jgi:16S rRNA (guanine527-N7)-methyltransferase
LTVEQAAILERYAALLAVEGGRLGLIGPNEGERVWKRHVLDSLTCAEWVDPGVRTRVADVGSGPGLPGIPVAVARPLARVSLIESMRRRCSWARQAAETLGLPIETLCERVEDAGRDERRGAFDVALSRAFASVSVLLECCLPLLAVGGLVVALRGSPSEEEVETAQSVAAMLGGGSPQWVARNPAGGPSGVVLVVEKISETPEKYPRRAGVPTKRPLRARPDSGTMPRDPGEA